MCNFAEKRNLKRNLLLTEWTDGLPTRVWLRSLCTIQSDALKSKTTGQTCQTYRARKRKIPPVGTVFESTPRGGTVNSPETGTRQNEG